MRRAHHGLRCNVMVAEVGAFREGGKDQPQQPEVSCELGSQAGVRSAAAKVGWGYLVVFEN